MRDLLIKISFVGAAAFIWYMIFSLLPGEVSAQTPNERRALIEMIYEKLQDNPDKEEILATIKCESDFNPLALGDHGESLGLVQINSPSWPAISPTEAFDPSFSMDFIIKHFKLGHARYWTCWRRLAVVY